MKGLTGKYEKITNNITVYRRTNSTDFSMKCQCISTKTDIPIWSRPYDNLLNSESGGVCSMDHTLSFPALKRKHSGYYKCHINSSSIGFSLLVIG